MINSVGSLMPGLAGATNSKPKDSPEKIKDAAQQFDNGQAGRLWINEDDYERSGAEFGIEDALVALNRKATGGEADNPVVRLLCVPKHADGKTVRPPFHGHNTRESDR